MSHTQSHRPRIRKNLHRLPDSSLCLRSGSLLLEAVIAVGIFAIFLGGIGFSLILGERTMLASGDRTRATFIASQQLEGLREIRNRNFTLLTTGTHGMVLTNTGWSLQGTSVTKNGFTASVTITPHETDWVDVQSNVHWNFQNTRSGSLALQASITDWRKTTTVGNWGAMTRIAKVTPEGTPDFRNIAISGDYAYLTGTQVSGGKGVYVYDISTPSSPVRIASDFNVGASAYGLAVKGDRLYLATDHPTQEVQIYDITSPITLSTLNLINSIDLPGSGGARAITVYGTTLYVGTLDSPPNPQFYTIQTSETGPMTILDSLSVSGSILDISLHEGYAYVAGTNNAGELQVIDIFDPANLTFAPNTGIDLTDVQDGNAIATFGTGLLIGRLDGSTIDELLLYTIADAPVPVPPPGPRTLEIGGDVNAIDTIAGNAYGFIGTNSSSTQLQVLDTVKLANGGSPVVRTYNAQAAILGLSYDWQRDRLFAVSSSDFFVFAPG